MTVQELIDALSKQDPDAFVELPSGVLVERVECADDSTVVVK